jgi:integral membrane protein (TIGR00529 family)
MLQSLIDIQTLKLLVVVASALTLSSLMQVKGLLAHLAATMESINPKAALHFIPAVVGLVPMPAGALVSATASQGLQRRMGLSSEQITFINYWFRHIWELFLPVYPAIIISSVVLSVPFSLLVATLSPVAALSVVLGFVISYRMLKNIPKVKVKPSGNILLNFLKASWPILLIVLLVLIGVEAAIAFPTALVLLALQQRPKWQELKPVLKYGFDPRILFLLYSVMLYKAIIEDSGTAGAVFSDMQVIGLPAIVILVLLPFIMGFITGISLTFAGVALPLLIPFIIQDSATNIPALLVAYTSGFMGVLLSPLHLCLILSAQYFKARLGKVYRYVLIPTLAIESLVILVYFIAN